MKQADYETWFKRSNGNWKSSRRYLYGPKRKADNYNTEFSVNAEGPLVNVSWDGDASAGDMKMVIDGDVLKRDVGYFTDKPTNSDLTLVDDDTLVMVTTYDVQHIVKRFECCLKILSTRVNSATSGDKITLVGQYFEERVVD